MIKSRYNVVGVMSGTSLDGVDLCWVEFSKSKKWAFKIIAAETIPYTKTLKAQLRSAIHFSADELMNLDELYTKLLGDLIGNFIKKHGIQSLDAVCSHGHTILHQPDQGVTLQIGNLPLLSKCTQQTVVCDFRVQDVALGGQGAPLVPIGDALLFSDFDFCLNLGGFSNISFNYNSHRLAFDIGPANILLNHFTEKLGHSFDDKGHLARSGQLNASLLSALNNLDYYKTTGPKSLGNEWVLTQILPLIQQFPISDVSILRTLVEHSAIQIAKVLKSHQLKRGLFSGGGVHNTFLMSRIEALGGCEVFTSDPLLIDFKEAMIFGFLGVLRLRNEVNCLKSVTGASQDHSSGKIYA